VATKHPKIVEDPRVGVLERSLVDGVFVHFENARTDSICPFLSGRSALPNGREGFDSDLDGKPHVDDGKKTCLVARREMARPAMAVERDGLESRTIGAWLVASQTSTRDGCSLDIFEQPLHVCNVGEPETRAVAQFEPFELKFGVPVGERSKFVTPLAALV
jgi:hypothetical protein